MGLTVEHTGLSVRDAGERALTGRRGGEVVGSRSLMGGERQAGESRVFPLGAADPGAFRVGNLTIRPIPVVPDHLAMAAGRKVAALKRMSLLLVERDERLVGFLDERALATAAEETPISAVMTPLGACLRPGMSIAHARETFVRTRAAMLPVIAAGFVLGAIARGDVERFTPDRRTRG